MNSSKLVGSICNMIGIVGLGVGIFMLLPLVTGAERFDKASAIVQSSLPWLIVGAIATIVGVSLKRRKKSD